MSGEPSFGQWLKRRRRALDLTQEELAQEVPCAIITLQKLEAGTRRPSKEMAERLAEHLGVPADERAAFVKFARMGPGAHRPALSASVAQLAAWSPWPRSRTNLPLPPTPLIGRDQDVAAVRKRLLDVADRLLTLVGPPGVGKTRLALQAAASLLEDFGDGVYLVMLAPLSDPDLVPAAVAQALGVNEAAGLSSAARLKDYLRDRHMLLVLDNFEQVAAAAAFVGELLACCPWLCVLVTSRVPLRIHRERQFVVPPLAWPSEKEGSSDQADWERFSAVALFAERARAVRPDFALTLENAGAVAAICARLDGLPLAIELAAARSTVLPPQALLERLGTRLMLHSGGPRDLPERHRTLHSAIDWSYALLSPVEQSLLARCGVFVGGWTLEAAEKVAWDSAQPGPSFLEALESLVTHSLMVRQRSAGAPRFSLLETIRAFALERLAESGGDERVRRRHAEYYCVLAEEAEPHLRTAEQVAWLDRLEAERGNLRAALAWLLDEGSDAEGALRLVRALAQFWNIRSHVTEGRHWATRALRQGRQASPALRAGALFWAGMFSWPGDVSHASSQVEESLALFRELGPGAERNLSFALTSYGLVKAYQGDTDAVQSACEEALALSRQIRDAWGAGMAQCVLGEAYLLRHDYQGACARFEQSLALLRQTGDKWAMGNPLLNWGYADSTYGSLDTARIRLEESVAMHRAVGQCVVRSLTLNVLAQVLQQLGDCEQAAALYAESLDLLRRMGLEGGAADVLHNLAYLAQSQGHYPLAARLYGESLALFDRQGNEQGMARCRAGLAAISGTLE